LIVASIDLLDNDGLNVMTGLVPVIRVVELPEALGVAEDGGAWMAGTSRAMTERAVESISVQSLDMNRLKKSLNQLHA